MIGHDEQRLRAEIDWLTALQQNLPAIIADQKARTDTGRATP